MIDVARTLQKAYILGLLAGAGALFTISLIFVALLKRDFKATAKNTASFKRRDFLRRAATSTIWISVAFTLASATASD